MAPLTMFWKYYLCLLAVIAGGAALTMIWRRVRLLIYGVRVEAEFVRWCRSGTKTPSPSHACPVVAFVAHDGVRYEFRSWTWENRFDGKEIEPRASYPVLYAPENPKDALICTVYTYWISPVIFLMFCTFAIVVIALGKV